jgi:hypothetical protein
MSGKALLKIKVNMARYRRGVSKLHIKPSNEFLYRSFKFFKDKIQTRFAKCERLEVFVIVVVFNLFRLSRW